MNGGRSGLALLHQHINTTGSQSQEGNLCRGEESRQQQKQGQQWQPHQSKGMGVARIELALGEL